MKSKIQVPPPKGWKRSLFIVLAILLLISFLLQFNVVAEKAATVIKKPVKFVSDVSRAAFYGTLGGIVIYLGVASLSIPIVGVALIAVGIGILAYSLWPVISGKSTTAKMPGDL